MTGVSRGAAGIVAAVRPSPIPSAQSLNTRRTRRTCGLNLLFANWLAQAAVTACNDGMAAMTHRTTFALDSGTVRRLKVLPARWQVSQAEAARRALTEAERRLDAEPLDLIAELQRYHAEGTLTLAKADAYLAQARADRKRWRAS